MEQIVSDNKIQQSKRNDDLFYETMIPLYEDIYKFILSRIKDCYASEEISHMAMIKAWLNLKQLRDPQKAKSWLFQIAHNTMIEYINKQKKLLTKIEYYSDDTLSNFEDKKSDIHLILENRNDIKKMNSLVKQLNDEDSEILIKHYIEGVTLKSIAVEKGMNYNTVRSISRRAVMKLKIQWDKTEEPGI